MQSHNLVAVVPLKTLGTAKGRLAGSLAPDDRRVLVLSMFEHVLAAATAATLVAEVVVVTADDEAAARAGARGIATVRDPGGGLNAAITAADAALPADGATLVLAADLPELTAGEVDDVARLGDGGRCVVVASTHDGGTGALLRRPGGVIPPRYGPGSAAAHLEAGVAAGVRTAHLRLPGMAHDIDRPVDLARVGHLVAVPGDPRPGARPSDTVAPRA